MTGLDTHRVILDGVIAERNELRAIVARLTNGAPNSVFRGPRYWLTDKGRQAVDEIRRGRGRNREA